jgi:hypothetical protein
MYSMMALTNEIPSSGVNQFSPSPSGSATSSLLVSYAQRFGFYTASNGLLKGREFRAVLVQQQGYIFQTCFK